MLNRHENTHFILNSKQSFEDKSQAREVKRGEFGENMGTWEFVDIQHY